MEKQSTRKFLKLIVALVALFLLGASALMLASCNKDEHQHSYTSSVTTPATCSNPGVETFTCSCGLTYTQTIPATNDHAWEKIKVYANSCESEGWTVYECSVCHEQKQDDWTPKLDHQYEAVETVEETCTKDGYQIMQCSYCGDRYTDDQYSSEHKATGHKWIVNESPADPADLTDAEGWKVVKAADCLNAAQLQRTCSVCGDTEEKVGAPATGHFVSGMAGADGKVGTADDITLNAALKGSDAVGGVCHADQSLVDAEGNKIYAFECENENCPVEVVVDARGNTKHYIKAVDHKMKTIEEHINCEDTDTNKSYILEKCKNCDTVWTGADSEDGYKKTYVDEAGHDYNTVQTDGKTSVVVCIEDKGLNTQDKYLEYMRSVVDFTTYQANWQKYVAAWNNAYEITSKPNIPTQKENGNPVLVVFDLNGNTLTMDLESADEPSKCVWLVQNELVFQNGNVVVESNDKGAFDVDAGASLTMDNVVLRTDNNAIRTDPTSTAGAEINLTKTTIYSEGNFGVATNANNVNNATTKDVVINIVDSYIYMNPNAQNEAGKGDITDNTALFINVPSKVTVDGSTLVANRQVVVVRGGTLEMSNTTLNLKGEFKQYEVVASGAGADQYNFSSLGDTSIATIKAFAQGLTLQDYRMSGLWGTGNEVPYGAIVMGNSSKTSYQYATNVTLASDVVFNIDNGDAKKIVIGSYYDTAIAGDAASPKIAVTLRAVGLGLGVNDVEVCWNHLDSTISFFGVDGYPAVY